MFYVLVCFCESCLGEEKYGFLFSGHLRPHTERLRWTGERVPTNFPVDGSDVGLLFFLQEPVFRVGLKGNQKEATHTHKCGPAAFGGALFHVAMGQKPVIPVNQSILK